MIMDAQNRPSFAQAILGAAATTVSTDSIDLLAAIDNPGRGNPMRVIATMAASLVGPDSIRAELISSASANLSTPTVLAVGPTVTTAAAIAGAKLLDVPMPDVNQRYLGLQYITIGAGSASAGSITAGVVAGTDRGAQTIPMNLG